MKKVKVMLTAITVLAVVGGALAFKASKFTAAFCTKSGSTAGQCTSYVENSIEAQSGGILAWTSATVDTQNCTKSTAPNCGFQTHLVTN